MALRPVLPALALGLLAVCASAAPEDPPPSAPRGVWALGVDLRKTESRLDNLLALAKASKDELTIRAYRRYSEEELAKPKQRPGSVRASDLWEMVRDGKRPPEVRTQAATVLAQHTLAHDFDPDLSLEGSGRRRPRAEFCLKITPELKDKDPLLRVLSHKILSGLWPSGASDPDIQSYNPDDSKTWDDAIKRWERILNRR